MFALFNELSAQSLLFSEYFTTYAGTAGTVPAGWTFSYNGAYTTGASSGTSGPNSYKFGVTGATIITPTFSGGDTCKFWIKGQSTDTISALSIEETTDGTNWTQLVNIDHLPSTGTSYKVGFSTAAIQLRFVYTKSVGNLAFDDFEIWENLTQTNPNGSIKAYFNHPVNNALSTGTNAIYLNNCIDDTLAAYINRAQLSIDVAMYNYTTNGSDSMDIIANAINAAYNRGVAIRWIHDGGVSNTALPLLNSAIPLLPSPQGGSYTIMHNKFLIFDAASANPMDAIVWTGSCNLTRQQIKDDYNNVIIVQDSALAARYTKEFNQMWGSTGMTPDTLQSKFGPYKQDLGEHNFVIGGYPLNVYFSPSDGTNNIINNTINTADSSLHFGVYSFTDATDANSILAKYNNGLFVTGIMDQTSQPYTAYSTLSGPMGADLRVFASGYVYHSKMLIVDESAVSSDPTVLTGSHNWSNVANTQNDENTLVVHSSILANEYYQSFCQNFTTLGGAACIGATLIPSNNLQKIKLQAYPNPSNGQVTIKGGSNKVSCTIMDLPGKIIGSYELNNSNDHSKTLDLQEGVYIVRSTDEQGNSSSLKLIVTK